MNKYRNSGPERPERKRAMKIINLQPSLLIIHDVKLRGGVTYKVVDRDTTEDGRREDTTIKTEKVIYDKPEFDAGRALRARIETLMKNQTEGARSEIGLFAPDIPATFTAIQNAEREIQSLIDSYHGTAFYNRITSRVITFRIQSDNRQALEAVSELIETGLDDLKTAVKNADVKNIRLALKGLKGFDKLLPDTASAELQTLINDMRKKARDINRLVNKQGKALDDSEVMKLMNAAAVDAAEMVIFDDPEPEIDVYASEQLPAADAAEFEMSEIPTEQAAQAAQLPDTTAADFQPDSTPEPVAEPAAEPAASEGSRRGIETKRLIITGPGENDGMLLEISMINPGPEHQPSDDWKDNQNEEQDEERDAFRAALLTAYESAETDADRTRIRKSIENLDAKHEPATV